MSSVQICLDQLDDKTIGDTCAALCLLIRKGVGLPTKVRFPTLTFKAGCARAVTHLALHREFLLRSHPDHADSLLKALSGTLQDFSETLVNSFAESCGYVFHACSAKAQLSLLNYLSTSYVSHQTLPIFRLSIARTALELSKHSADALLHTPSLILPMVFLGRQSVLEAESSLWAQVWENLNVSAQLCVRTHFGEMCELFLSVLSHPSWEIKQQSAKSISAMAKEMPHGNTSLSAVLPPLLASLNGRLWSGKGWLDVVWW